SCTKDRVRRWRCRRTYGPGYGHCSSPDRGSDRFIIRLELTQQPSNLLSIVVHMWAWCCVRPDTLQGDTATRTAGFQPAHTGLLEAGGPTAPLQTASADPALGVRQGPSS